MKSRLFATYALVLGTLLPACKEASRFIQPTEEGFGPVEEVTWTTMGGILRVGNPLVLAETLEDVTEVRRDSTGASYVQHFLKFRLARALRGEETEINGVSWVPGAEVWVEASDPPCQNGTPERGSTVLLAPHVASSGQTPSGEPAVFASFLNMLVCSDLQGRLVFEDHPKFTMGNKLSDIAKVPLPVFEQALAERRFLADQDGVRGFCSGVTCSRGQRCFFGLGCVEAENLATEEAQPYTMDGLNRSAPSVATP